VSKKKRVDRFHMLRNFTNINKQRRFEKNCLDPDGVVMRRKTVLIDVDFELPCIMKDYPVCVADPDVLLSNLYREGLKRCAEVKFDDELGWYME